MQPRRHYRDVIHDDNRHPQIGWKILQQPDVRIQRTG